MIAELVSPTNILTAIVAIACFCTVITLAAPALKTDKLEGRLKSANSAEDILAALIHLADDRCVESVWVNGKRLRST